MVSPEFLHQLELILILSINVTFRFLQPVRHVRPSVHVQLFGNPFQCHRRLRPQPFRNPHFAGMGFGATGQL